ncbi:MAG: 2-hydroxyacyl-CoA dehydratase [Candidatus Hydrogenedentota bacterium]|nr:MAG: 2-hydroxyacyl-CoA dehydratase [Candidatus Hydrogenedentota bacterium]
MRKMPHPDFSFFHDIVRDRHRSARELSRNKRLFGYFCDLVPEELLHAAGFIPVRITGARKPISLADRHLQSNVCSFARSCLELALEGAYRYLSGIVIPHSCDIITKMNDLWAYRVDYPDFCHYLWYPHKVNDPSARSAFIDEVRRLKSCLEEFFGTEVSDESLWKSIACYNENRQLLRDIYELRKPDPPRLSGTEAFSLTLSSMLAPKDEHSLRLRELRDSLEQRDSMEQGRPRILVSASALDSPDLIESIEGLGGMVVADDVCTGIRYFWVEVGESDDPLEAVADRYLRKIPCPRTFDSHGRIDFLMRNITEYNVQGVIIYILRCCDAQLFQMPGVQERIKAAGVPVLYLQGDHSTPISEETHNRIAAFIEMLGG